MNDSTNKAGLQMSRRPAGAEPAIPGVVEWFQRGDRQRVQEVLEDIRRLDVGRLRVGVSWADYELDAGRTWYEWLLPRLAEEVEVLPCFTQTPPPLGIESRPSSPPRDPSAYADFLQNVLGRFGTAFQWVELWNEPNHLNGWDRRLDPSWTTFAAMVRQAAECCHANGKKALLGGMCPADDTWLDAMFAHDALGHIDAVGIHGFPRTWEDDWDEWDEPLTRIRRVLDRHEDGIELWITAAGYSTWRHDEYEQLREFVRLLEAPAERIYWYAARDLYPTLPYHDVRHAHFGLVRADGSAKLLYRIWAEEGLEGVHALAGFKSGGTTAPRVIALNGHSGDGAPTSYTVRAPAAPASDETEYALITGGAGFIGTNVTVRLLKEGRSVMVFDNLSRPGVEQNLRWLLEEHSDRLIVRIGDVRDPHALREAVAEAEQVYHFAGQVAVTKSVMDPLADFEVNLRGTVNLLEALRRLDDPPPLLFTSTNKVYGNLDDVVLQEGRSRYDPADPVIRAHGIGIDRALDFHSPYGCSKGAADQYVLDYARIYSLPAVVFRMSCIYGPHQVGTEDQGWVAHFLMRALRDETITLFGDGKQVRDILFVEDLVDAMLRAQEMMDVLSGKAFNIGGDASNSVSLLELLDLIGDLRGAPPTTVLEPWRPGDQRYYVSDTRAFTAATGWRPRVPVRDGVEHLYEWLRQALAVPAPRLIA